MGPGPMMGPPPGMGKERENRIKPPENVKDIPRWLRELVGGFFSRLFYVFRLVWETNPAILFFLLFFTLFEGVMPVVGSLISRNISNALQTDYGVSEERAVFLSSSVFFLLVFLFLYKILNAVMNRIRSSVVRIAGERVVRHVRLKIMHKAREVDAAAYDSPAFYEKLENANQEAGNRPIQILSAVFGMVSTIITLVSYLMILFSVPGMWWSALVIVAVSVPSAIITFTYRKKNVSYMRFRSKERRQMNYYANLMVNKDRMKEIRIFDLSDTLTERYENAFDRYFNGLRRLILGESCWHVGLAVASSVVNCVFFAMIAFMVFSGDIMIGDYQLLTGALSSVANGVATLISSTSTIYEGTLFIDNLICFMAEKQTVVPRLAEPLRVRHGMPHTFEFRHVSFSYPGSDHKVLDDVNLTLRQGESLVLVGLNGAGKTTLLKLMTRLYDPTGGEILLDGENLQDYDIKDLYSMFGIIFQDFGQYAETVEENIHYGSIHKEILPEEIREAARASGAAEYIEALPGGYKTPLMRIFEQDGTELSGGQWQKLAISRAFYSSCDVLILDEPTAALDALAEQEIYNEFDQLRQGKTTVFVSHRLSSATTATKIAVLEYGRIIEEGTHRELMHARGRYFELFSTQARRYREDAESDIPLSGSMPPPPPFGRPPFDGKPPRGEPPRGGRSPFDGAPPFGEKAPSDTAFPGHSAAAGEPKNTPEGGQLR